MQETKENVFRKHHWATLEAKGETPRNKNKRKTILEFYLANV